ncbi:ADP-ribose pyrophosphatase [Candidatus Berkelbacteria bacterium CG10_big_fil_rev_8_21_14_0_10_43_13]|uniref:ADP-ribose pyrophosphatase n=1 Tax=Candidatus Berkelbacteria bacterium CG10_big_fil_rev_8_21_14_0_10_43_13 TaxID=1974514 RepID=A0A2H0W6I8_9BACT|nr:MAG: ADP-ribose pyrophosphatase [Candidatus Berkelbacteria bacterium CG10_big_fil_rev_8_21_14_0_10_43_13]
MIKKNDSERQFSWKTISKEYVYSDERIKVRKDKVEKSGNFVGTYTLIEKNDFVLVIPKNGDKFYLVDQDRYPIMSRSLEFIEGGIEVDANETPEQAATRELLEEVGISDAKMTLLGHHWLANGHHTQGCYIFLAEDGKVSNHQREQSESDMETLILTETEIEEKIADGTIKDTSTVAAFMLYQLIN